MSEHVTAEEEKQLAKAIREEEEIGNDPLWAVIAVVDKIVREKLEAERARLRAPLERGDRALNVAALIDRLREMPPRAQVRASVVETIDLDKPPLDSSHDGERVAAAPVMNVKLIEPFVWIEASS